MHDLHRVLIHLSTARILNPQSTQKIPLGLLILRFWREFASIIHNLLKLHALFEEHPLQT